MKTFAIIGTLALFTATSAIAAPSYLQRNEYGGYDVTYSYTNKVKSGWYLGGRTELSLLNFEIEATTEGAGFSKTDKYSFEPVFGGNFFVGHTFNYFWRVEAEAGLLGRFKDSDTGTDFQLTIPYAMANVYYDFTNGLYVGGGLGIALPKTEWDNAAFETDDRKETDVSPMFGLMFGYTHKLDDNFVLDLRYRLAGLWGTNHTVRGMDNSQFTSDIGLILDNSLSVGLRYEF